MQHVVLRRAIVKRNFRYADAIANKMDSDVIVVFEGNIVNDVTDE